MGCLRLLLAAKTNINKSRFVACCQRFWRNNFRALKLQARINTAKEQRQTQKAHTKKNGEIEICAPSVLHVRHMQMQLQLHLQSQFVCMCVCLSAYLFFFFYKKSHAFNIAVLLARDNCSLHFDVLRPQLLPALLQYLVVIAGFVANTCIYILPFTCISLTPN